MASSMKSFLVAAEAAILVKPYWKIQKLNIDTIIVAMLQEHVKHYDIVCNAHLYFKFSKKNALNKVRG